MRRLRKSRQDCDCDRQTQQTAKLQNSGGSFRIQEGAFTIARQNPPVKKILQNFSLIL